MTALVTVPAKVKPPSHTSIWKGFKNKQVCPHEAELRQTEEQLQLITQPLGPHVKCSDERFVKKEWNLHIYP